MSTVRVSVCQMYENDPLRVQQQHVRRRREKLTMGIPKRPLLCIGLAILTCLGILVYFRLWIIDYKISTNESELIRKQFDLANKEAMDESAEWRSRFDEERERATKCMMELNHLKESRSKMPKDVPNVDERLEKLQLENADLHESLKSLKQELEVVKLNCKTR